jgi:hypothetical protein
VDQGVTPVTFRFGAGDDVVALGNGTLVVSVAVDDARPEDTAAACSDGVDNDADGFVDCNDFNCAPFCPGENTPGACSDGLDNDADGFVDCADFDCAGLAGCP